MVMSYILFVVGIYLVVKCADLIVEGSSALAKKFGVSAMVVGLTITAFGTSLPELVVNIWAVLNDSGEIIFGNIIGSNIANILLILGITAVVGRVNIKVKTVYKQIPFALLAGFILLILSNKIILGIDNPYFTRLDGVILLSFFVMFLYNVYQMMKRDRENSHVGVVQPEEKPGRRIFLSLVVGIIGIYFGGKWVVEGVLLMASAFQVNQFLISATVLAIGTSLPELAVSIFAVSKGKVDLAVGNVIGSNVFNILWVLGIIPLIKPLMIPSFVGIDILVMIFATIMLFFFMFIGEKHQLRVKEGAAFIVFYLAYILYIIYRG
jgi:cation:H+ antiporter